MLQYSVSVALGGSALHIVPNKIVTVPEIAVLRQAHGADAVRDFAPAAPVDRSDSDERERLRRLYDQATPDAEPLIDRLFGPMAPLPKKLSAIGIDPKAEAAALKERAAAMAKTAAAFAEEIAEDDVELDELFDEEAA